LNKRLKVLEATTARQTEGPWLWPEKLVTVERLALKRMSPEDRVFLEELFTVDHARQQKMIETHRGVWDRWQEAFNRETESMPNFYVATVYDRWGA
jgi:hypothetical protein